MTYDPTLITGLDGSFEIIGPQPGVDVRVNGIALLLEGWAGGPMPANPATMDVVIELERAGVVTGTVRGADNGLLAGVPVALSIEGLDRSTATDGNGQYRFEHVKLGPFSVQARLGTGPTAQYVTARSTLTWLPQSGVVNLRFPGLGTVSGHVTAEGGAAAAQAEVVIENRDYSGPLGAFSRTTATDSTGLFTAGDVLAGPLRVSAFTGIFGGWNTVTLTPGTPATVDIQIGSLVKLAAVHIFKCLLASGW